jgi:alpha-galactosidase
MLKRLPLLTLGLSLLGLPAVAVIPSTNEFLACAAWCERLIAAGTNQPSPSFLKVIYEDVPEGITRGRSWRGTPYQLGDRIYSHGIAFNSTKHILVRLGRPAARFSAEVGLENNDDTRRGEALGQGSVTFHVVVGGGEVFQSQIFRRKDGARPISIRLNGAREFELQVKDGGDGRGWDQALWAEAVVEFEDGSRLRLQDLPDDAAAGSIPFSFRFGGVHSAELLTQWTHEIRTGKPSAASTRCESTWKDPRSGLEIRLDAIRFEDFPAVEWVLTFTNTAATNSAMLEDIQALDRLLPLPTAGQPILHWAKGAVASFDDFAPQTTTLGSGGSFKLQPGGGRSSSQVLPFFNLEGAGAGIVAAIGWSGEWAAEFSCSSRNQVLMKAGMERSHLVLYPGEGIRTPRLLLLFYEGDQWRGQNLLRQFILSHHRPQVAGKPLVAPITCGNWGGTSAEIHLDNIRKIEQQHLPIAYYWIDAEWYGQGGWPVNVGTWEVKPDLYPAGFKPLSEALRKDGRELMLWFEPERVFKNTRWHKEHPEWLLGVGGENFLFNLGNPAALKFLTDFISARITEFGLGCYRQDFNMDPLPYWRAADAPDRQGISEIRHIEGLYAFWDELLRRHPGLLIDNCASGGRRIDLETVGRATPFWRTDGPRDPVAHQCHSYGLLGWVPLSATSQDRAGDNYEFRSSMCSALCLNWWVSGDVPAERIPADFPFDWARATLEQYLKLRPLYDGDYYPLTGYSTANDVWMAYQLDRPDLGQGMVVALRRPESPYESVRLPLHGLQESRSYRVRDLDSKAESTHRAKELLTEGLALGLKSKPGSAVLLYERQ